MEQPIIIFGAGGLGKLALEIFNSNEVVVYGFLDDRQSLSGTVIDQIPVLGVLDDQAFLKLIGKKCQAFVAESDKKIKRDLIGMLNRQRKVMPVNALHRNAFFSSSSTMGHGNLLSAGVVVNAHAHMGNHCILHSGCTIDYDVTIRDFVEIGAGGTVGAEVIIGNNVFIGAGATLVSGITVGDNARIGAGSVVVSNIGEKETVFGNPAQLVTGN